MAHHTLTSAGNIKRGLKLEMEDELGDLPASCHNIQGPTRSGTPPPGSSPGTCGAWQTPVYKLPWPEQGQDDQTKEHGRQ